MALCQAWTSHLPLPEIFYRLFLLLLLAVLCGFFPCLSEFVFPVPQAQKLPVLEQGQSALQQSQCPQALLALPLPLQDFFSQAILTQAQKSQCLKIKLQCYLLFFPLIFFRNFYYRFPSQFFCYFIKL